MCARLLAPVLVIVCAFTAVARAEDPFTLTAQAGPIFARATGNNLVDLASNLIKSEAEFTPLNSTSFTGALRYGEEENAVLFSRNAAGTSATLSIPSTGFTRTFTAANENDLENQIEDFFKQDGADAYADFLREVGRRTS